MKKSILGAGLALIGATGALAAEWRILDQVGTPADAAMICHFWGTTVFAPGEKPSCLIGTLYTVDLAQREIFYENATPRGLPIRRDARDLNRRTLINAMTGEGVAKLEHLRAALVARREEAQKKTEAERARADYLAAFDAATTFAKIADFESRYTTNDPDELIPKLEPIKARLTYEKYRADYAAANTSADLNQFVTDYNNNDPDNLVSEAKIQIPVRQKQELLAQQQAEKQRLDEQHQQALAAKQSEKKRKDELRQQELAAKRAAAEMDRKRIQYIQQLRTKYAENIVAESADAHRIVRNYNINCRLPDGRVLPLAHVLYATAARADEVGGRMVFHLQSRGRQVRIYASMYKNGKPFGAPEAYYQINEWDELQPIAVSSDAVLSGCIGFHGPVWIMPGEPGY